MIGQEIKSVAVVGAGTMGQGIAQVFASAGFQTMLFDVNTDLTAAAISSIGRNLDFLLEKGRISAGQKQQSKNNLHPCAALHALKADLIIEAIVEKLDVKQELFRELEKINGQAVLVTNTSSLSVSSIASVLDRPERCVGLHFFNPAPQMSLVEVISGSRTDPGIVAMMMEIAKKIGKIPVRVKDSPGFIVNRVARHYYVESLKLLEEKAADVSGIDKLLKSAGFKMGPFELMDLIGIDINYFVTESLYNSFDRTIRFKPSDIQRQKINDGHLGRKTSKGFYDYPKN